MTDDELYQQIATADAWAGRPFTHAGELADRVGLSRQGVRQRVEELVQEREDVHRYKPSRDVIYFVD